MLLKETFTTHQTILKEESCRQPWEYLLFPTVGFRGEPLCVFLFRCVLGGKHCPELVSVARLQPLATWLFAGKKHQFFGNFYSTLTPSGQSDFMRQ